MSEGKRPGGLTALAVINFVLAGLVLLGVLGFVGGGVALKYMPESEIAKMPAEKQAEMEKAKKIFADPTIQVLNILNLPVGALLIISGVGYLLQKKVMGRILGNCYVLLDIVLSVLGIVLMDPELVEGAGNFNLMSIVGFIYPLLTLFLVNVTFKEDLVN